uniref:Uncharacterized protein n=1 Tax=Rhodococcus hoagii TaxID=43767 RepID=A0A1Z1UZ48_RHOHA|nr:hypothetical protein pVAPN1354_0901 [Prescottella equi]ARX60129.1 hypothetical protein pVAPN1572_0861 [Prescottella equi]
MERVVGYPLRAEVHFGELLQLAIFSSYTTKLCRSNAMGLARI